jgi:hypothetical protein
MHPAWLDTPRCLSDCHRYEIAPGRINTSRCLSGCLPAFTLPLLLDRQHLRDDHEIFQGTGPARLPSQGAAGKALLSLDGLRWCASG